MIQTKDKMQFGIQEDFIKLICEKNSSCELIQFFTQDKRIGEDEILKRWHNVYSVTVRYAYPTHSKSPIIKTDFRRNGMQTINPILAQLTAEEITTLRSWSKKSGNIIAHKLQDRNSLWLQEITFFFLPTDFSTFIVPNLLLENMVISKDYKGNKVITTDSFITEGLKSLEYGQNC